MASEPKDLQSSMPLKIGGKTVAEHLEELDPKKVFNPGHAFFYCPKAIGAFHNALTKQSDVVESLSNHKPFINWLRKAAKFLSELFLNTSLFNPHVQKEMQPLIDLMYYFKKADPTIGNIVFRFELMKLLEPVENSNKNHLEEAIYFRNALIGQPVYVLDILRENLKFTTWLLEAVTFSSTLFSNPSIFDPNFQKKIQPLIDLLYYLNRAESSIHNLLCRFEVIKRLTENSTVHSAKNYIRIYNAYFADRMADVFENRDQSVSAIIETALSNCRQTEKNFALASQLEQACFVAWLIPYIKRKQGSACFDKTRTEELFTYLEKMHNTYFSPHCVNSTYSAHSKMNLSLKNQFAEAEKSVDEKLKKIDPRDHKESPPEVTLKDFFLELFAPNKRLSFFSSAQYPIVDLVMETAELYIDWHYVVEQLLAESEKENSPSPESRDLKRLSFLITPCQEIVDLCARITSFSKKWEEAWKLKIPAPNELDAVTKNKENEPSSSVRSYAFG